MNRRYNVEFRLRGHNFGRKVESVQRLLSLLVILGTFKAPLDTNSIIQLNANWATISVQNLSFCGRIILENVSTSVDAISKTQKPDRKWILILLIEVFWFWVTKYQFNFVEVEVQEMKYFQLSLQSTITIR